MFEQTKGDDTEPGIDIKNASSDSQSKNDLNGNTDFISMFHSNGFRLQKYVWCGCAFKYPFVRLIDVQPSYLKGRPLQTHLT